MSLPPHENPNQPLINSQPQPQPESPVVPPQKEEKLSVA